MSDYLDEIRKRGSGALDSKMGIEIIFYMVAQM